MLGYYLKKGNICIHQKEAMDVNQVIQKCIAKESPTQIAKWMNKNNIPTLKKNALWTHAMVSKMIRNLRYSGADDFPIIISKSEQLKAIEILENRAEHKNRIKSEKRNKESPFYKMIYCGECQCRMRLYENSKSFYWECSSIASSKKCSTNRMGDYIWNESIYLLTLEVINEMIGNTNQIIDVGKRKFNHLNEVLIENEIKQLLKEETTDIELVHDLLQKKYLIKYKELDTIYSSETVLLKRYLQTLPVLDNLEQDIIKRIFKKIVIYSSGKVEFVLVNHQVIERKIKMERRKAYGKSS